MGERRTGGLWTPQTRALTVGLVLTITFVASEALAVVTVMPVVARDLGGLRLDGWVFSAFMLGSVVGIVAAGREADRRGPAVPFVAALILFGSGLAIAGLAPSMEVLVGGRVLQGMGAGAVPSVAYAVIGRSFPGPLQARMMAGLSTRWLVAGRAGAGRGGGAPVRVAVGVPGPAAGGRGGRIDSGAGSDPPRPACLRPGSGAPADLRRRGGRLRHHAPGRTHARCRFRRCAGRRRVDRGRRGWRAARTAPPRAAGHPDRPPGPARHDSHPGPADLRFLRRRCLRDTGDHGGAPP